MQSDLKSVATQRAEETAREDIAYDRRQIKLIEVHNGMNFIEGHTIALLNRSELTQKRNSPSRQQLK